jgi:hypothetical protein
MDSLSVCQHPGGGDLPGDECEDNNGREKYIPSNEDQIFPKACPNYPVPPSFL